MDKNTKRMGQAAARLLQSEVDTGELTRSLVNTSDLQYLLDYVKALEEPPVKVTKDVYLRGEWWNTILKVDLTEDQLALLRELGERSKDTEATVLVEDHNPEYPLRDWKGYTRK